MHRIKEFLATVGSALIGLLCILGANLLAYALGYMDYTILDWFL
jgi:hypothetical protein